MSRKGPGHQRLLAITVACCTALTALTVPAIAADPPPPYGSTYVPQAAAPVLFRHATILTGSGACLDDADLLLEDGRITGIGKNLTAAGRGPAGGRARTLAHARHPRSPFAPGRRRLAPHRHQQRHQRADQPFHAPGLGRAFGVAAGPRLCHRAHARA
ncbi:hypothetical protein LP419_14750 [Massilia sp. H-1]|nr:hypothetical protein LP419_14750 [Massilia sp. H-1]